MLGKGPISLFCIDYPVFERHFLKNYPFPFEWLWHPCQKLFDHIQDGTPSQKKWDYLLEGGPLVVQVSCAG